jgi:hypothetical protein
MQRLHDETREFAMKTLRTLFLLLVVLTAVLYAAAARAHTNEAAMATEIVPA